MLSASRPGSRSNWAAMTAVLCHWPGVMLVLTVPAVILGFGLGPLLIQREVSFQLELHDVAPAWSLQWVRPDGGRNGVWLSVGTPATATRTLDVVQRLPSYRLSALEVCWTGVESATFAIERAELTERVLGVPVRRRALAPGISPDVGTVSQTRRRAEFVTAAPVGAMTLQGKLYIGTSTRIASVVATYLLCAGLIGVTWLLRRVPWSALTRPAPAFVLGLLLIVGLRAWINTWAPFFYTWDSTDYIANALGWLNSHSLSFFNTIRPPGYSLLLAGLISLTGGIEPAAGWANAGFGIASAALMYATLRRFARSPWPLVGLLVVGLDPVLLTYERYALTESMTVFAILLVGWLLTFHFRTPTGRHRWWADCANAIVLGLVCGLAVYLRTNLVVLLGLVPLALLIHATLRHTLWRGLVPAVVSLGCALLVLPVSVIVAQYNQGRSFAGDKRLEALWERNRLDLNQTAMYSAEAWRVRQALGLADHMQFWRLRDELRFAPGWPSPQAALTAALDEMYARRPGDLLRSAWDALAYQSGLRLHSGSAEWAATGDWVANNSYFAEPLRGRPWDNSNVLPWTKRSENYPAVVARFPDFERNIGYLRTCPATAWFDRWYGASDLLRPPMVLGALVGVFLALRVRCYGITAIAWLALGNLAALALLLCPTDRYGVPFSTLLVPVAVYAIARLARRGGNDSIPDTSPAAPLTVASPPA